MESDKDVAGFGAMTAEDFADLEKIVGPVDREAGLTNTQLDALSKHSLLEVVDMIDASPVAAYEPILSKLIKDRHFVFNSDGIDTDDPVAQYQRMFSMLATQAYKIFLVNADEVKEFISFGKANPIKSFAGPDHQLKFPSANTWIEIVYPEGTRPMIVPQYENIQTAAVRLRVNRIAIHATCAFAIFPFPFPEQSPELAETMARPTFLKDAHLTIFVETEGHGIQMYTGTIEYGCGGAKIYKVFNAEQAARAIHGEPPTVFKQNGMPHFAQFGCGTLTQLLRYFKSNGTYEFEALRAHYTTGGQTGFTDDLMETERE